MKTRKTLDQLIKREKTLIQEVIKIEKTQYYNKPSRDERIKFPSVQMFQAMTYS